MTGNYLRAIPKWGPLPNLTPVVKLPSLMTLTLDRRRRECAPVFEVGLPARGPLGHDVFFTEIDPRGSESVVFRARF